MKNYTWKQRYYSYAHLVDGNGKSLCNKTKTGGIWQTAKPELGKCKDCLRISEICGESFCDCDDDDDDYDDWDRTDPNLCESCGGDLDVFQVCNDCDV